MWPGLKFWVKLLHVIKESVVPSVVWIEPGEAFKTSCFHALNFKEKTTFLLLLMHWKALFQKSDKWLYLYVLPGFFPEFFHLNLCLKYITHRQDWVLQSVYSTALLLYSPWELKHFQSPENFHIVLISPEHWYLLCTQNISDPHRKKTLFSCKCRVRLWVISYITYVTNLYLLEWNLIRCCFGASRG